MKPNPCAIVVQVVVVQVVVVVVVVQVVVVVETDTDVLEQDNKQHKWHHTFIHAHKVLRCLGTGRIVYICCKITICIR
jgi:hypothetical protein